MSRFLDVSNRMGKHNVARIGGIALTLHATNQSKAHTLGKVKSVVFHWTAGTYTQVFDAYHVNIAFDAVQNKAYVIQTVKLDRLGEHLWHRNTGAIGISFAAMWKAERKEHGKFPVTPEMLELGAQVAAEICAWRHLDPRGNLTHTDGLVAPVVSDHLFYAKADGYEALRWDVEPWVGLLRGRTATIYDELKGAPMPNGGRREFEFEALFGERIRT